MIAGLLFANYEIDVAGDGLAATRPFAGATLIEHQARQLAELGATQVVVIAAQPTAALIGAIGRMGRQLTVDRVATVAEAAAAVHPLASVLLLADGIVAGSALLAPLAGEGGELLVAAADDGSGGLERLGGGLVWAGAARIVPERIVEAAALPSDYDPQSTLVRVTAQAGARVATIGIAAVSIAGPRSGEAEALVLDRLNVRQGWFSRYIVRPVARLATRFLTARPLPSGSILAGVGITGLIAIAAIAQGWPRTGLLLALAATILAPIGAAVLSFRGEELARQVAAVAVWLVPALTVLALGVMVPAIAVALALIGLATLGERAGATNRWWSGDPGAYLLVVTIATMAGVASVGLAAAALYAFATLAARIEQLRQRA